MKSKFLLSVSEKISFGLKPANNLIMASAALQTVIPFILSLSKDQKEHLDPITAKR